MLIGDKLTRGLSNLDNLIKQLISNNLSSLARDVFPDVHQRIGVRRHSFTVSRGNQSNVIQSVQSPLALFSHTVTLLFQATLVKTGAKKLPR